MMPLDLQPTLWRVAVVALVIGLAANVLLWSVSSDDDVFADIVSVASGVAAVAIIVSLLASWPRVVELRAWALLLAFAAFTANVIEFVTEDGPPLDTKLRQSGLYLGYAVLALGLYLANHVLEERRH